MDETSKPSDGPANAASYEVYKRKRPLWHSDRWAKDSTFDFYADSLWLIEFGDGKYALELACSGQIVRLPIVNPWKYI